MPIIFKQQRHAAPRQQHPSSSSFGSQQQHAKRPSTRGLLNAATVAGASIAAPGRRIRASIHEKGSRARRSISRFRHRSSSLGKYIQNPKLIVPLVKAFYQKHHLKHLIPLFFVLLYMLLGAVLFLWLEAAAERQRLADKNTDYEMERSHFVKRVDEIMEDTASPPNSLKRRKFVEEAVDHLRTQLGHGPPPPEPEWSFSTSMYFAGTIFTTIGYGDIACETFLGRLATVVYAIFGIPLMLITLNELGKFLYKSINEFMAALTRRYHALRRFFKCLGGARKNKGRDLEKGMDGTTANGPEERRKSVDKTTGRGAVSFNINETEEELSLQMEVTEDPDSSAGKQSPQLQKQNSLAQRSELSQQSTLERVPEEEENGAAEKGEVESGHSEEEEADGEEEDEELAKGNAPRMHVMVAIVSTFAWIFLCATLFRLWEEWTYWESLYFMFISLLTIGLGDVNVRRRDLMVLCFIFVIIGLSLVSMCINVIQSSLEDLYRKLLLKILADYQAALSKGGNHKSASLGVMKAFGGSRTAKLLMPMLSENTKRSLMQQVQEEAKESGMEIPPIFENFETFNEIMTKTDIAKDEEARSAMLEEILKPTEQTPSVLLARSASFIQRENQTQTEIIRREDKNDQTAGVEVDDLAIQTELSLHREKNGTDAEQQTDVASSTDEGMQTMSAETKDVESMTTPSLDSKSSVDIQTDNALCLDSEVQTFAMVGMGEIETQTDEKQTKNQRIQTPAPVMVDAEAQSEEINPNLEKIHSSRLREARRRIRRAFRSQSKGKQEPSMLGWQECQNDSSEGSVDWDPYDGMHAEKQKPVSQLKKMFDAEHRNSVEMERRESRRSERGPQLQQAGTSSSVRRKEGRAEEQPPQ